MTWLLWDCEPSHLPLHHDSSTSIIIREDVETRMKQNTTHSTFERSNDT